MNKIICVIFTLILILVNSASSNDRFLLSSIEESMQISAETKQPVLIIFGAEYCGACKQLKTDILNDLSEDSEHYIICYVDTIENPDLAKKYNITLIPESRIYINGEYRFYMKGYSKTKYKKWLYNGR